LDQDDQHHRAREKVEVHVPIKRRHADELRLKRAMLNLLRNAIGCTPKAGGDEVELTFAQSFVEPHSRV
jgi:hypothetical protein